MRGLVLVALVVLVVALGVLEVVASQRAASGLVDFDPHPAAAGAPR